MQKLIYALVGFSVLGIIDTGYLSYARLSNSTLNCSLLEGCNAVASSPLSVLFGIPLAYLGLAFYITTFIVSLLLLRAPSSNTLQKFVFVVALGGFLASLYFVYLQVEVIRELCVYCIASAANSTLLFILSIVLLTRKKQSPLLEESVDEESIEL